MGAATACSPGRLRHAAGGLESHEPRFHSPGFVGPIGAAVAAGHLLGFDAQQFVNAIGVAGSRCGGLFVNLGTMAKASRCAYAADVLLDFGQPLRIQDPGYAIKIFPAKFSTHYAIIAALMACRQIPTPAAIRAEHITAADVPSSDRPRPRNRLDGKFSLPGTARWTNAGQHVNAYGTIRIGPIPGCTNSRISVHSPPLPRPRRKLPGRLRSRSTDA